MITPRKDLTVEQLLELWTEYRATHQPSVLVMAKRENKKLLTTTILETEDNKAVEIAVALGTGFLLLGWIGVANLNHARTNAPVCTNLYRDRDPDFTSDLLEEVGTQFGKLCRVSVTQGRFRVWSLHPSVILQLTSPEANIGLLSVIEKNLEQWENEKRAFREFNSTEQMPGWQKLVLTDFDLDLEDEDDSVEKELEN